MSDGPDAGDATLARRERTEAAGPFALPTGLLGPRGEGRPA